MDYKRLLSQMESLKQNSQSFITEDSDPIWQADVEALDEAMDIIADYEKVTVQLSEMMQKYEQEKAVIDRGPSVYQCPDCGASAFYGNEHCWRCGRKLGWKYGSRWKAEKAKKGGKHKCRK